MDNIIETSELKKSYQNRIVVENVNLHVKKGEIYGFVGPNGAGKSTIMKMLVNLVTPDSGEIRIFGQKVTDDNYEQRKRIGSLIENPYFYNHLSGMENLDLHCAYMGYYNKEQIGKVMKLTGLFPDRKKKAGQYSLGMKQRLAIARAILTRPELLILDEPINALDPEGIREMRELFQKINTECQTTILISSHILSEVEQIADTIGILCEGKLQKEISMADIHSHLRDYVEVETDNTALAGCLLEQQMGIRDFKIFSRTYMEVYDLRVEVRKITAMLVQNGVGINRIGRRKNSLEDYFFQITGQEENHASIHKTRI